MCTIITLFRVHPTYPLVIAANRDERYERPSSGPELLAEPRAVVGGRDQLAGGTWFGVNAQGVAIAIADQGLAVSEPSREGARRNRPPLDLTKRSRGLLVLDALACSSVEAVSTLLADQPADRYNWSGARGLACGSRQSSARSRNKGLDRGADPGTAGGC